MNQIEAANIYSAPSWFTGRINQSVDESGVGDQPIVTQT